jgi:hypothetical protein
MEGVGSLKGDAPIFPVAAANFDFEHPQIVESLGAVSRGCEATPVGGHTGDGPYTILIPPEANTWLMMNTVRLKTRCRIVKGSANTPCAADDIVAPVNNFACSMFAKVDAWMNNTTNLDDAGDHANYKSYIEACLSYEGDARDTHLRTQLLAMDTVGQYDTFKAKPVDDKDKNVNYGFKIRYEMTKESKVFETYAPLQVDFFKCSKFLAPGNNLTVRLTMAAPEWLLNSNATDKNYKVVFDEMVLTYRRITVDLPQPTKEIYPHVRSVLRHVIATPGVLSKTIDITAGGIIPRQIIFFMVRSATADGRYDRNPYNFEHFNMKTHYLTINGRQEPFGGLRPHLTGRAGEPEHVSREIAYVYENTGTYDTDRGSSVSNAGFTTGQFILPHDLTPDKCNGYHLHPAERGYCSATFEFNTALPEAVTIFFYCSYNVFYVHREGDFQFELNYI